MKTVALSWIVILLVAFSTATFAQDKYVSKANEELYGTWTNSSMNPQKTVVFSGGYKDYTLIKDTIPVAADKEEIVAKWTDSDGNT